MWFFALVQKLSSGRIVALRHQNESDAIRGLRRDMVEAWMFHENSLDQCPAEVLYVVLPSGMMIRNPGIHEVPRDVLDMLSPAILVELAA